MTKRPLFILFLILLCLESALCLHSQPVPKGKSFRLREFLEETDRQEPLNASVWSFLAVEIGGDTLAGLRCNQRMLPASNLKLITTGTALHELGENYRYKTTLAHSGSVQDGELDGDLYILGGGDPTIASGDSISLSKESLFSQWASFLNAAGISKINGLVIGDGRYFDGAIEADSWQYQDLGTYYGTGGDGLCFYRNMLDIRAVAGAAVGDSVILSLEYPSVPWLNLQNNCITSAAGTGDNLYLYTTDLAPSAQMRGYFSLDHKPQKEQCSNKFGDLTCAHYFSRYLSEKGVDNYGPAYVDCKGRIITLADAEDVQIFSSGGIMAGDPDDLSVLGSTQSPKLKDIVRVTNHRSDNFYAETLLRTLGKKRSGSASYEAGAAAVCGVLSNLGLDPGGELRIVDGSGLSRKNYVSAGFICAYLEAMSTKSPAYGAFLASLGVAGSSVYPARMKHSSAQTKSRVRMKSGSMDGVRCYSGYILPSSASGKTIVFSIMVNNCTASGSRVYPVIDRLLTLLADEN